MDQRSEAGLDPRPGRLRLALAAQAEADSLRARRAERLARIRTAPPAAGSDAAPAAGLDAAPHAAQGSNGSAFEAHGPKEAGAGARAGGATAPALPGPDQDGEPALPMRDVEALERFLADLVGTIDADPAPPQPARLAPTRLAPVIALARPADAELATAGPVTVGPAGDAGDLARLPGAGPGLVGALIRGGVPDLTALAGLGRDALSDRLGPLGRLIDLDGWLAFARAVTGRTAPVPERPAAQNLAG